MEIALKFKKSLCTPSTIYSFHVFLQPGKHKESRNRSKIVHCIKYLLSTLHVWFGPCISYPKHQNISIQMETFCICSL